MKEVNSGTFGPHRKIDPLQLSYKFTWNGAINSGNVHMTIGVKDKRYPHLFIGQIYGGSTGIAKSIFPYKTNMTSFLDRKTYLPKSFTAEEIDKKETKKTTSFFTRSGVTCTEEEINKKSKKSEVNKTTFLHKNTYDLLSCLLYIRSLDLKTGQTIGLVTHPFSSPYFVRVKVLGKEKHLGQNCYKLDIKINKIGSDMKLRSYKKLKKATLWLTDDANRIPIELRSKVFIGDVRMTLKSMKKL